MPERLHSDAIVFEKPGQLRQRSVLLAEPTSTDLVVDVSVTGISSGTEKLLWQGTMPAFPGLAYPLVPGYEAVGYVRMAGADCTLQVGDKVFVPGASCYQDDVRGLFGASASTLVVSESRVTPIGSVDEEQGALLALAATAMHILTYRILKLNKDQSIDASMLVDQVPDLIIGHGVLGRLLARICVAVGGTPPVVWENTDARRSGAQGYACIEASDDSDGARQHIVDVSGACGQHFNTLISRLARGGQLTLAGFYSEPVTFDFAPAFMREASLGIAAEWAPQDLSLVMSLLTSNALSLDGLITHKHNVSDAAIAYPQAFEDPACLKTILNWRA